MAKARQELVPIGDESDDRLEATDVTSLQTFLRGIAVFFVTAAALEKKSAATLAKAMTLTPPMTIEEDASIQTFIQRTTAEKKAIEHHWGITGIASRFHKRLVAARNRSLDPLNRANDIGNRLHNEYVLTERRRAAEEQERLRRLAEEQARKDREAELAKLEAEAVACEEASPILSEREEHFVAGMLDPRAVAWRVAQLCGYKDFMKHGDRLMNLPKIQDALHHRREARAIRQQAEAQRAQPLDVEAPTVQPEISSTAGGHDRATWTGEVLDEAALIAAVVAGKSGIPQDVLTVNRPKLNEYARSLHERLNLWPGVRAKKTTRFVG